MNAYHVSIEGSQQAGTQEEILKWLDEERISPHTLIWSEEAQQWVSLRDHPDFLTFDENTPKRLITVGHKMYYLTVKDGDYKAEEVNLQEEKQWPYRKVEPRETQISKLWEIPKESLTGNPPKLQDFSIKVLDLLDTTDIEYGYTSFDTDDSLEAVMDEVARVREIRVALWRKSRYSATGFLGDLRFHDNEDSIGVRLVGDVTDVGKAGVQSIMGAAGASVVFCPLLGVAICADRALDPKHVPKSVEKMLSDVATHYGTQLIPR